MIRIVQTRGRVPAKKGFIAILTSHTFSLLLPLLSPTSPSHNSALFSSPLLPHYASPCIPSLPQHLQPLLTFPPSSLSIPTNPSHTSPASYPITPPPGEKVRRRTETRPKL